MKYGIIAKLSFISFFAFAIGCTSTQVAVRTPAANVLSKDDQIFARTLCIVATLSQPSNLTTPEYRNCMQSVGRAIAQLPLTNKHEMSLYICENLTWGSNSKEKAYPRQTCYSNAVSLIKNDDLSRASSSCKNEVVNDPERMRQAGDCYKNAIAGATDLKLNSSSIFETLPLCSRIKFLYAPNRSQISSPLPESFDADARREAKQIWEMSALMSRDTRGLCRPDSVASLMIKPEYCSQEWSGPYLEPSLAVQYERLVGEDFQAFVGCWR